MRASGAALRQKILDEALAGVRSRGVTQLTMRSLAERLDLSPASLYLYFRSKQELLRQVATVGFLELERRATPALRAEDPVAALRGGARAYLEFALGEPALYRLMFEDASARALAPDEQAPRARLWASFREPYLRGVERGVFRREDPDVVTMLHLSLMHGFVSLALSGRNPSWLMAVPRRLDELFEALVADRLAALRP